ncbi:MAG: hypothetical protein ACLUSP_04555 [Christensenellales bacterium]
MVYYFANKTGRYEKAEELLFALSPVSHTLTEKDSGVYAAEPYVVCGDVYASGEGGWSWYRALRVAVYRDNRILARSRPKETRSRSTRISSVRKRKGKTACGRGILRDDKARVKGRQSRNFGGRRDLQRRHDTCKRTACRKTITVDRVKSD